MEYEKETLPSLLDQESLDNLLMLKKDYDYYRDNFIEMQNEAIASLSAISLGTSALSISAIVTQQADILNISTIMAGACISAIYGMVKSLQIVKKPDANPRSLWKKYPLVPLILQSRKEYTDSLNQSAVALNNPQLQLETLKWLRDLRFKVSPKQLEEFDSNIEILTQRLKDGNLPAALEVILTILELDLSYQGYTTNFNEYLSGVQNIVSPPITNYQSRL